MLGEKITQVSLSFGVDDIDGTVVEERITKMAGGATEGIMTRDELIDLIKLAGKTPVERDTLYHTVRLWN
jgi:aminodeoxyfutalosine synthase